MNFKRTQFSSRLENGYDRRLLAEASNTKMTNVDYYLN